MKPNKVKMSIKEQIIEANENSETPIYFADGFDEAILGIDVIKNKVIYSIKKCYLILIERDGMTEIEAQEWMAFNVVNADFDNKAPIWCYDNF